MEWLKKLFRLDKPKEQEPKQESASILDVDFDPGDTFISDDYSVHEGQNADILPEIELPDIDWDW